MEIPPEDSVDLYRSQKYMYITIPTMVQVMKILGSFSLNQKKSPQAARGDQ
jgi:hypothetical protein